MGGLGKDYVLAGHRSSYAAFDPSSVFALEYNIAAAGALYHFHVAKIDPGLSAEDKSNKIGQLENVLRVEPNSIRKHYIVIIKLLESVLRY